MAGPTQPDPGEKHIDASGVDMKYVDDADLQKMIKLRAHHDRAMNNIMVLTAAQIAQAGLNEGDVAHLRTQITEYREVMMFLVASRQLTENLQQTVHVLGHEIAAHIGEITAQARRRAKVSPDRGEILNALNQVIDYQLAPSKKANLTKLRAKREAESGSGAPAPAQDKPGTSKMAAAKTSGPNGMTRAAVAEEEAPLSAAG
ncbi:hypothetical protein [Chondromyces apiculatus]|uniref:Uncharacterized protein n=1 Tax=Chondromyces apiculatus DSM 436 TaxID=1192034 RepID=A0A017T3J8_9BACT|nr:hypothetical protein [Chondromyces apiculatus]EYF03834.1 Hypothetical protein CAP_5098 [Chondromyces apiculatus DSM 436]